MPTTTEKTFSYLADEVRTMRCWERRVERIQANPHLTEAARAKQLATAQENLAWTRQRVDALIGLPA